MLTLVTLLLLLDADGQIVARFPVDLVTLGVVVDEIATVAALILIEVSLGDGLVGEELVLRELEDQSETRLVKVLHANVDQVLQGALVTVGNHLSERDLVLHRGQPELGDTRDGLGGLSRLLLLLSGRLLGLLIIRLAGLDLGIGWLGRAVDNLLALLIQGGELGEILLLELETLLLELSLALGVLFLDALETCNTLLDLGWERLDVTGRAADQRAKSALDHLNELGVLCKDGGGGGTIQVLYGKIPKSAGFGGENRAERKRESNKPSLMLATPGCWACDEMGALVAGVF